MTRFSSGLCLVPRFYGPRRLILGVVLSAPLFWSAGVYSAVTFRWLLTAAPTVASHDGYPIRAHVAPAKLKRHGRGE